MYCSLYFHVHLKLSSLKSPLKIFSKSAKLNLNLPTSTSTLHHYRSKPQINQTSSRPSALPKPHLLHPPPAGPLQCDTSAHFQATSHLFSTRQPAAPQKHTRHVCISHTCSPAFWIKSAVLRAASAPGPVQPIPGAARSQAPHRPGSPPHSLWNVPPPACTKTSAISHVVTMHCTSVFTTRSVSSAGRSHLGLHPSLFTEH